MTAARDPWLDEQEALRRDRYADEFISPPASTTCPVNPWNEYEPGDAA